MSDNLKVFGMSNGLGTGRYVGAFESKKEFIKKYSKKYSLEKEDKERISETGNKFEVMLSKANPKTIIFIPDELRSIPFYEEMFGGTFFFEKDAISKMGDIAMTLEENRKLKRKIEDIKRILED